MESRPRFSRIGYRTHRGCGLPRNPEAPVRALSGITPRPDQTFLRVKGSPPDWFWPQPNPGSTEPRSGAVPEPSRPVPAQHKPVLEAHEPQSFWGREVKDLQVGQLPLQSGQRDIARQLTEPPAPASGSDHLPQPQTTRKPEENKESLAETEAYCSLFTFVIAA